jgi:pyruvate formate lyase activating enzyme
MREAMFYEKVDGETVKCLLCPVGCVMADGQRSFCRVREPVDGKLYTLVYELICSAHVDPIEKKPIFHMLPGSRSFSIATAGCNSRCKYCQNWTISQKPPEETTNQPLSSADVVLNARKFGCASISYTYTEPTVFYEYMHDSAAIAVKSGIKTIMVTGGKINTDPLKKVAPFITAAHVDFKGFDDKFLKETCAQDLKTILNTLTVMKECGIWIEIINLIVPTLNDSPVMIRGLVKWVKENLGPDTPLHFSKFWPQYKLRQLYPTPKETLMMARDIAAAEGMRYVYIGNEPELAGAEDTFCPSCKKAVIRRGGYTILENRVSGGACGFCGGKIAGIWS